ncbi:ATP-binding protein [Bacillus sp. JJ1127]|uniref:sensor histidine kinase n=1 Tax=Bacillus sp. JJ1127 TaxID=3122952 RepID=UPI002FFE144C
MFFKTRRRLTILFTGLMMIFLLSFIFIAYMLVSSSIIKYQREAVIQLVKEEWAEHKNDLLNQQNYIDNDNERDKHPYTDMQTFYYILSKDGQIMDADNSLPYVTAALGDEMKEWKPRHVEVRKEMIVDQTGTKKDILFAGLSVEEQGKHFGTIIAGTNVTAQQQVLDQFLLVLSCLSILFLILSLWLGYFMAGKAMIPILHSFQRQKEFVSDASHELRTPLSIMQSSLEVIEVEEKEQLSPFSQQIFHDMKDEVKRMTKLVADLLTIARSDSGILDIRLSSFDLYTVLEQLVRSFQLLADQREITIVLVTSSSCPVIGDKERITQLLYILIDNAVKYNKQGGSVYLKVHQKGKIVEMIVEDTGIGIPKEQLPRIFDRFYRIDKARSRDLGSNGIGLSIAKWIAESHGGTIHVESEVGRGTTFRLQLPSKE